MKGKKVGVWFCGNEFELFAALDEERHRPEEQEDVTIVKQPFDMNLFLQQQVDAASAMTYNELAQVLETKNPETGQALHARRPERDQDGTPAPAMLEDGDLRPRATGSRTRRTRTSRSGSSRRASRAGSTAATTRTSACSIVLDNGPTLGEGHQRWQMNEINALIWPNPRRGRRHGRRRRSRAPPTIAKQFGVIKKAADEGRLPHRPRRGGRRGARRTTASTSRATTGRRPTVEVTAGGK